MVIAGVLIVGTVFFPPVVAGITIGVLGITATVVMVTYSYFAWRQETSR